MRISISNSYYNTLASMFRIGASLFTIPLIYIFGTPELYGDWVFINSVMMTALLVEGGLTNSMAIMLAQQQDRVGSVRRSHWIFITVFCALLAGLGVVVWPALSRAYASSVSLEGSLLIAGLIVVSRLASAYFVGYAQSLNRYDIIMQYSLVSSAIFVVLGSSVFMLTQSIEALLAANLMGLLVGGVYLLRSQATYTPFADSGHPYHFRMLTSYFGHAASLWAVSASEVAFTYLSRLLVGVQGGSATLANFGLITTLGAQIVLLASSPAQTLVPLVASRGSLPVHELMGFVRRTALVAVTVGAVIVVTAGPLLSLLGHRYTAGMQELLIGVFIYTLIAMNSPGYFVLIGLRRTGILIAVGTLASVLCLLLIHAWVRPGSSHIMAPLMPYAMTAIYVPVAIQLMKKRRGHDSAAP